MTVYIFTETSKSFISTDNLKSKWIESILLVLGKKVDNVENFSLSVQECRHSLERVNSIIKGILPELEPIGQNIGRKVNLFLFNKEYTFIPTSKSGHKLMNYYSIKLLLEDAIKNNVNLKVIFASGDNNIPEPIIEKIDNIAKNTTPPE
ncbi:hypothetical protein AAG747_27510 [Rapidithrix thailandica]|uniref:Uncharacterized protein n=1 Tax=Rapidithrix thailandica TaxID=413964 RepID=A0AAW9SFM6_9BACT